MVQFTNSTTHDSCKQSSVMTLPPRRMKERCSSTFHNAGEFASPKKRPGLPPVFCANCCLILRRLLGETVEFVSGGVGSEFGVVGVAFGTVGSTMMELKQPFSKAICETLAGLLSELSHNSEGSSLRMKNRKLPLWFGLTQP